MSDRRILQWEIKRAKDKAVYTFTGWEGFRRGSMLLTEDEAEFFRERLTLASPPPVEREGE